MTVECPVACVGFFERFGLAVQEANEQRASMRGVLDNALNKCVSMAILASIISCAVFTSANPSTRVVDWHPMRVKRLDLLVLLPSCIA